jgi:hypothetical protein
MTILPVGRRPHAGLLVPLVVDLVALALVLCLSANPVPKRKKLHHCLLHLHISVMPNHDRQQMVVL